jgi:hypothetical protein
MEKVYTTEEEVLNAIQDDGRILGVVSMTLGELTDNEPESIDDMVREKLVGGDYAYQVFNPLYSISGVNVEENLVYIEVSVDASGLK